MKTNTLRKGDVVLVRMTVSRDPRLPADNEAGRPLVECNFGPEPLSYSNHYVDAEHIVSVESRHFNPGEIVDMGGAAFEVIAQDGPCLFVRDVTGGHNVLKANDVRLVTKETVAGEQ